MVASRFHAFLTMCFDAHGALVIHPLLAQFFAVLTAISPPFSPLADSPAEGKVAGCFRSCRIAPHDLRPGSQRSTKVRTATARIDALGCASQMTKHSKIASEIIIRHISVSGIYRTKLHAFMLF
nr:hypothetical protein CFP56_21246 [Quercus suber]